MLRGRPGRWRAAREAVHAQGGAGVSAPLPVFNPALLAEISGGDRDYEREILAELLEQAEDRLAFMARALEGGDAAAIARAAHTLKGSGSTLGAEALAACCGELERMAEGGDLAPVAAALERARHTLAETRVRLDEHVRESRRVG